LAILDVDLGKTHEICRQFKAQVEEELAAINVAQI
jgi:hypothetical protein